MGLNLGDVIVKIGADVANFQKGQTAVIRGLLGVSRGATQAGTALTAGLTLPLLGAAAASIKFASDFDSAMTQSTAIMTEFSSASALSAEQQENLRTEMEDTARGLSKDLNIAASDVAEGFFFLASAGLNVEQQMKALPQVAAFAKAGMFDLATATDLATDAQSALGLTVQDADQNFLNLAKVTDVLVKANTLANASVEQFSTALTTKAGAALKILNKDVTEGVAVLAAFADQGVKAQDAGTALNIVLRDLSTKAIKNKEAFAEAGVAVFDAAGNMNNMADIIGDLEKSLKGMSDETAKTTLLNLGFADKSVIFIQTLLGQSEAIREYEKELKKAGGTTQEVADNQLKSFSEQMGLAQRAVEDIAIELGMALIPIVLDFVKSLEPIVAKVSEWIKAFGEMDKTTQVVIVTILGLVAAIGPLLLIAGQLGFAITALVQAWPLLVIGVSAAGGALATLLPLLAAVAVGVALGGAIGLAIEDFLVWAGVLDDVSEKVRKMVDATEPSTAQIRAMAEASEIAGREITSWSEATVILTANLENLREANSKFGKLAVENADLVAKATEEVAASLEGTGTVSRETFIEVTNALGGTSEAVQLAQEFFGELSQTIQENAARNAELEGAFDETGAAAEEAAEKAEKLRAALDGMVKTSAELQAESTTLSAAIQLEGGAASLTASETERLAKIFMTLVTEGGTLDATMMQVVARNQELAASAAETAKALADEKAAMEIFNKSLQEFKNQAGAASKEGADAFADFALKARTALEEVGGVATETFKIKIAAEIDTLTKKFPFLEGQLKVLQTQFGGIPTAITPIEGEIVKVQMATFDWAQALQDTANIFTVLGIEADSTLGRILGSTTALFKSMDDLSKLDLGGIFGGGGGGGGGIGDIGGIFGGLFGGGGGEAAAGAAEAGAEAGGGFLGGLTSIIGAAGPLSAAIGPAIAVLGSVISSLVMTEAEKIQADVERDFGVAISMGLAKAIEASAAEVSGDRGAAIQLNLGDIIGEAIAGGDADFDAITGQIADTFSFLERGQISATQAQDILNDSVAALLPHLDELGPAGEEELQRIIDAAAAMGIEFEGLSELILSTFAPLTFEEFREQFGLANESARLLAELTGVPIQTNLERMAVEAGITAEQMQLIVNAAEAQGISMEELPAFAEALGVSVEELGPVFAELGETILQTFAPSTIEELNEQFGLTREQIAAIEEATGVKVLTNFQKMAMEAGLTAKEFRALADAAEDNGVAVEDIDELAAAMGLTVAQLAEAWGVDVVGATKDVEDGMAAGREEIEAGVTAAEELANFLADSARNAANIDIPNVGAGGVESFAHGGFAPTPMLAVIGDAPGGEFVIPSSDVTPLDALVDRTPSDDEPGAGDGGEERMVRPVIITQLMLERRVLAEVIEDMSRTGEMRINPSAVQDFGS